jgi:hypothetical protein
MSRVIRGIVLAAAIGAGAGVVWSQPVQPVTLQDLILAPGVAVQPDSAAASGGAPTTQASTTRPSTTRPALTATQEKDARDLVKQLGADDYTTREQATDKLIALGEAVQSMLKAKLQEKDLDPEVAHRIGIVIRKTTPAQEGTEVTDEATGITASIQPLAAGGGNVWTVQARQNGQVIWQSNIGLGMGTNPTLRLMEGQLLVLPQGLVYDLGTGRRMPRRAIAN